MSDQNERDEMIAVKCFFLESELQEFEEEFRPEYGTVARPSLIRLRCGKPPLRKGTKGYTNNPKGRAGKASKPANE